MKHKRCASAPGAPLSADAIPLREVVVQLAAKRRKLSALDDAIGRNLAAIEEVIRRRRSTGGPVDVPFPPWGKLGWSGRRGPGWRFVVVDDEVCVDLSAMSRGCRSDACLVLGKLVERLGLPSTR